MNSLAKILINGVILSSVAAPSLAEQVASGFQDSQGQAIMSGPRNASYREISGTPEYIVGPRDVLQITLFDGSEPQVEFVRILPDSTVSFSIIPKLQIGGLTISEVSEKLGRELANYIRTPNVQVSISEYVSKSASVFGSINSSAVTIEGGNSGPGRYPLKARTAVLDLIIGAGGPTSEARLNQVRLIRGNTTYLLDIQRATQGGDNSQNPYLEHGDILRVPGIGQADRRVTILGEVRNPGVFNLSDDATMLEIIASSAGFTQDASANRIRVIRRTNPINPTIYTVNAERIFKGDLSQNLKLVDGDIVVVPRDWLTDLNDLLVQLQPIIAWNGLITPEPLLSVGGYEANGAGLNIQSTDDAAAATNALQEFTQQSVLSQVQQNLKGSR